MELFSLTCTTCQKRLKVLDASTIGQLSICPHCGSMVLVEPPPQGRDADAQVTAPELGPGAAAETPAAPPPLAAPAAEPPVITAPAPSPELPKSRQPPAVPPVSPVVTATPDVDASGHAAIGKGDSDHIRRSPSAPAGQEG